MTDEERLQDYIDERMSAAERLAFEAELTRNPDLAAAARFAHALGKDLRGGTTELPPGFYARARARFEASRPRRFRLRRRLPWEAVGLAAAAAVVLVLLFPWTRTGRPVPPLEAPLDSKAVTQEFRSRSLGDESGDLAAPRIQAERDSLPVSEAERTEFAPTPALGKATESRSNREPRASSDELRELPSASGGSAVRDERMQRATRVDESPSPAEALPGVRFVELPFGSVPRGTTKIIESSADDLWISLTSGPFESEIRALAPQFDHERMIVFGPQVFSVACQGVRIMSRPDDLLVVAGPAIPASTVPSGGCALVIPRGNLPVVLDVSREY